MGRISCSRAMTTETGILRSITPDEEGEAIDHAPPLAWALIGLSWLFWIVAAVAFDYFGYCYRHGAHRLDKAGGYTYFVNNHGDYRFIRPGDYQLYIVGFEVGFVGLGICIGLALILFRPAVVRHILITRRAAAIPVLIFLAMAAGSVLIG